MGGSRSWRPDSEAEKLFPIVFNDKTQSLNLNPILLGGEGRSAPNFSLMFVLAKLSK